MRKFFYYVCERDSKPVDTNGDYLFDNIEGLHGQTRELARSLKRDWWEERDDIVICKFDRTSPYKFLGEVS